MLGKSVLIQGVTQELHKLVCLEKNTSFKCIHFQSTLVHYLTSLSVRDVSSIRCVSLELQSEIKSFSIDE